MLKPDGRGEGMQEGGKERSGEEGKEAGRGKKWNRGVSPDLNIVWANRQSSQNSAMAVYRKSMQLCTQDMVRVQPTAFVGSSSFFVNFVT